MSKKRILLIDDEAALTWLMRMALERTGKYEVRVENDSSAAVKVAKEFLPDLIILDLIMPGQDGGDVVDALKKEPELKDIPVGFLTATVRKADIEANGGIMQGYPFLAKPASQEAIYAFVEKLVRK